MESDIDLFIIGDVSGRKIASALANLGTRFNREINYSIFPVHELHDKIQHKDHFFTSILKKPYLFIVGNSYEFI